MTRRLDIGALVQFGFFGLVFLLSYFIAIYTGNYFFLAAPVALLGIYIACTDMKLLFYCLVFFLPLSVELELPGGFSTDMPDELFMVGLMFLTIIYIIISPKLFNKALLYNPVILLLAIHFTWIIVTVINSSGPLVSFKYLLSKTWYLIVFVVLASMMIRTIEDFKKIFWLITIPLTFTIIYSVYRHALNGFSFLTVNFVMWPFFRNHVNYAAMISEWIPFLWLAHAWYKKKDPKRILLLLLIPFFTVALFLSYTRSSWLALVAAVAMAFVIQYKLVKPFLLAAVLAVTCSVIYITQNNKFLDYSPNFEKTIYHEQLGAHLTSTYQMRDISSAERLYRWVAALQMWETHPIAGFGPGNFYNFYKSYTVTSFRTYVSKNKERSTVHNYFILMLVEQGVVGLFIFCLLTGAIFIYAEKIYHKCNDKQTRRWILAIAMSLAAIYVNNSLSDMIETDKVGTIYFMNIAMLAVIGYNILYSSKKQPDNQ